MLHKTLDDYLARIDRAIMALEDAYIERYLEEVLTPERATLRIRVRFTGGHLLEINEAIAVSVSITFGYKPKDIYCRAPSTNLRSHYVWSVCHGAIAYCRAQS